MSSCGRTLLDTINHILDYSKINTFERSFNNARKRGSKLRGQDKRKLNDKDAPPMMNLYQTIDVAAVTEEVVEGVYAGQIYQDISSTDVTDFSHGAQAEALERGVGKKRKKVGMAKEVEVIIDIAHEDYVFTTQPGALKRVRDQCCHHVTKLISTGHNEHLRKCSQVYSEGLDYGQSVPIRCGKHHSQWHRDQNVRITGHRHR